MSIPQLLIVTTLDHVLERAARILLPIEAISRDRSKPYRVERADQRRRQFAARRRAIQVGDRDIVALLWRRPRSSGGEGAVHGRLGSAVIVGSDDVSAGYLHPRVKGDVGAADPGGQTRPRLLASRPLR